MVDPAPWHSLHRQMAAQEPGLGSLDLAGLVQQASPPTPCLRSLVMQRVLEQMPRPPRRLLLLHGFVVGGVERVAAHAAQAVAAHWGSDDLLVLATDQPQVDTLPWFADAGRTLALPALEPEPLPFDERALLLAQLIRFWRPGAVLNLHSAAGWRALERFGEHLTSTTRWSAGLFCRDRLPNGMPISHADRYLRSTMHHLERVICDHQTFLDQLGQDFALGRRDRARLQALYQPVAIEQPARVCRGERLLWAGRLCAQKRPDLVARVAALRPDLAIDIHGPAVSAEQWRAWGLDRLPNVQACGPYQRFADLPLQRYGALLFTSDYEGLPNVLLEAGAAGLPIVAMAVGGVPELIHHATGWPVPPAAGAQGLVAALDRLWADRQEAERRVSACRDLLRRRHSSARYWQTATHASAFFRRLPR